MDTAFRFRPLVVLETFIWKNVDAILITTDVWLHPGGSVGV